MKRFAWPLITLLVCLPLILLGASLATGYRLPWLTPSELAEPQAVPAGDYEIVWFNTTTGGAAWERFVAGVRQQAAGGVTVDDSRAFPQQSTDVPEVVLHYPDRPAALHIRWYKLSTVNSEAVWIAKLAARTPAPLAVIGGGSSDRARDLALALNAQSNWQGERPLFFITNATAENLEIGNTSTPLMDLYPQRTFRFCFSNRQITEAILDFLWQQPGLRPQQFVEEAHQGLGSGLLALRSLAKPATIFGVCWQDDPYSVDFMAQFSESAADRKYRPDSPNLLCNRSSIPSSIGGYVTSQSNAEEGEAFHILESLRKLPEQRAVLVVPTVPGPARRLIRALCDADPAAGRRLVAINGDGMGVNALLRDGRYVWPIASLPIPLVLFTHANPIGGKDGDANPAGTTEEVLHAAKMIDLIVSATYQPGAVTGAESMAARLRATELFDAAGNRESGSGEYVLVFRPARDDDSKVSTSMEVWTREVKAGWTRIGIVQR